uniref:Cyp n=1 Tax=Stellera chamaejasme TaxID=142738 RepID=A0A2R4A6T5_9ROSI|nr:cyp [Stellera chamaejasme]
MLSLTSASLKPKTLFSSPSSASTSKSLLKPISAIIIPSSSKQPPPQQQLYQPFRPPPSPLPSKFRSLDAIGRIDVLANRLGLWFEYAPLISSLYQEGFTPQTIEEATGITGGEQNRLIVGAQVRESLIQSNTDPDVMGFFDTGGAELLYEIRLLSASQRAESARFIVENSLDMKGAEDLARSIKDFPRRRGDKAWDQFDYKLPGDCLAFMYFRQSKEHRNPSVQRNAALQQALQVAGSESAKSAILAEIEGGEAEEEEEKIDDIRVPVVRLKFGEVATASNVVVLPVCRAEEVLEAPWDCKREGAFGVVVAEKGWQRWVVLPQWEPLAALAKGGGVVVSFPDARALPWRVNRWYKEEPVLVVADRGRQTVEVDDGFYLVATGHGADLKVRRGSELKVEGVEESLGTVIVVVRPPKYETDDQLSDEDWE